MGDHKQLPAVVLQSSTQSEIRDEALQAIGLTNLKDSLFERLYKTIKNSDYKIKERAFDSLHKQGRMHPIVASFPNMAFYGGLLESTHLPHQTEKLVLSPLLKEDEDGRLMTQRIAFLPSSPDISTASGKINRSEAMIAARLAHKILIQYESAFNAERTLGIITPYRNQIALIKREIAHLGIAPLNNILVDTVERFQGSERDVIIYSFCINYAWQLKFLSNTIEEYGMLIARKLNVALTRARKQLFVTGVSELLSINSIYADLLKAICENQNQ
jgi:superfamily I DNA and/or RNA helicase